MPLKFKFKAREEIPAEHQGLYVERDGSFVLDVEGAVEKTRLDEFRSTNVALRREVESLNTRLADNSVESMVLQVASKFGVRAAALPDLTNRAGQIFRMVDGELRPLQRDGKTPVLGADGANVISFEEWVTRQVAEAPHLFESSAGGGASGSGGDSFELCLRTAVADVVEASEAFEALSLEQALTFPIRHLTFP